MRISEAFDTRLQTHQTARSSDSEKYIFKTETNQYRLAFIKKNVDQLNLWDVGFGTLVDGKYVDRRAETEFKETNSSAVFATVMNKIIEFLQARRDVHVVRFAGADEKLTRLYSAMAKRISPPSGYSVSVGVFYPNGSQSFALHVSGIDGESLGQFLRGVQ